MPNTGALRDKNPDFSRNATALPLQTPQGARQPRTHRTGSCGPRARLGPRCVRRRPAAPGPPRPPRPRAADLVPAPTPPAAPREGRDRYRGAARRCLRRAPWCPLAAGLLWPVLPHRPSAGASASGFAFRLPAGAGLLPAARGGMGWRARGGPCPRACCWEPRAAARACWRGGCVISGGDGGFRGKGGGVSAGRGSGGDPGRAVSPRAVVSLTVGTAERRGGAGRAPGHAAHGRQGPAGAAPGRPRGPEAAVPN